MEHEGLTTEYPDSYRTGHVQPPKSHRRLVTVLLLLVIFLGSLVSVLGFANIRLTRLLNKARTADIAFVPAPTQLQAGEEASLLMLGVRGRMLTEFDRQYFSLPPGLYVTASSRAGILPGDVLTQVNGTAVCDWESLQRSLAELPQGTYVSIGLHRAGAPLTMTVQTGEG